MKNRIILFIFGIIAIFVFLISFFGFNQTFEIIKAFFRIFIH